MKTKLTFYSLTTLALVLGACTPSPQPTQSAEEVAQQIRESVALTVAAGDALTAAAQPQFTATVQAVTQPSATPFPTLTPFATLTPFVVVPSGGGGSGGGGGGGGGTSTDPRYDCVVWDQIPHDSSPETILKTGDSLDVKWTLKNTGTKTWQPTWAWIVLSETVNSDEAANKSLSTSPIPFSVSVGTTVAKNEYVTLAIELHAPTAFDGRDPIWFTVQMAVVGDGVKFCTPWIQVEVIRPGMTP